MVSDQEIARGVEILLLQHPQNSSFSSVNGIVQQLGAKLGLDLSHKTSFIRDHINLLRQSQQQQQQQFPVFGFQNPQQQQHSQQFLQFYQQQQQQQRFHLPPQQQRFHLPPQQQQQFPPQFGFQFSGFPRHAPPQIPHAPPVIPTQQVVIPTPPAPASKNGSAGTNASKESAQSGTKRRGGAGGLNKLCGVSPELQVVVGEAAMARTEMVRQLWAYIRKNNLQDPSNKRKIICDDALRAVFEIDCTDMFKMNKLLAKHILPYDSSKNTAPPKRQKVDVESTPEPTVGASPVKISDALALFLGTTEKEMLPSEARQRVMEYIKDNNLEDSSLMTVNCDEKLRALFGCESIPVLGINDLLARDHLLQSS